MLDVCSPVSLHLYITLQRTFHPEKLHGLAGMEVLCLFARGLQIGRTKSSFSINFLGTSSFQDGSQAFNRVLLVPLTIAVGFVLNQLPVTFFQIVHSWVRN